MRTDKQVTHPSLLELGDVDRRDLIPAAAQQLGRSRRTRRHEQVVVGQEHDVGAALLGHALVGVEGTGPVNDRVPADDRPVRQRGHGRLQVQGALDRHGLGAHAELLEQGRELADALTIGPSAQSDVCRVTGPQDISPVERARRGDSRDTQPEVTGGTLRTARLALALVGSRVGDDGQVAVDDDRVLDEDGVRTVLGRLHLDGLPARGTQARGIRLPLGQRDVEVDGLLLDMGDETVGQTRAGTTDEGAGT